MSQHNDLAPSEIWVPNTLRYESAKYQRCGNSGILLPPVSLGLWKNFGDSCAYLNSLEMLHYAFDNGITHFDLANNYGPPYGSAETSIGRAIEDSFKPYRDELFISTKAGYDMWPGPYGNWGSRKYLTTSLHQSLKRMKLDYIDLFYSHRYDPNTPLDETLQAMVDIVKRGEALYLGISRWPLEATRYAIDFLKDQHIKCLVYQGRLNLLDRELKKSGIINLINQEKIGFVSFSPLAQGLLTNKYLSNNIPQNSRMSLEQTLRSSVLTDVLKNKLHKLNEWAENHNMSLSELALLWVLSQPQTTSAIIGVSSKKQLKQNIQTTQLERLTEIEQNEIEHILVK